MDKHALLLAIARKRQQTRWTGYKCVGDYHGGAYECDFVSPYTKSAGNVDAEVFVLLQDWSSDERLSGQLDEDAIRFGHTPELQTNLRLTRYLRDNFDLTLTDVYGTNLFPFIKAGALSASIPSKDLVRAATEFALPQIRIVAPKLVVCLGLATFSAMQRACSETQSKNLQAAIDSPFSHSGATIWCQAHTGTLGQNTRNRGGIDRVSGDWSKMKNSIQISKQKCKAGPSEV